MIRPILTEIGIFLIPFGERYIWGLTAGILRNLHERIYRE